MTNMKRMSVCKFLSEILFSSQYPKITVSRAKSTSPLVYMSTNINSKSLECIPPPKEGKKTNAIPSMCPQSKHVVRRTDADPYSDLDQTAPIDNVSWDKYGFTPKLNGILPSVIVPPSWVKIGSELFEQPSRRPSRHWWKHNLLGEVKNVDVQSDPS